MVKRSFLIWIAIFWLVSTSLALAEEGPSRQLESSINRIIEVLNDPALKAPEKKLERRNLIFKIMEEQFDFTEMSKRSLGEFWQKLSEPQQKEFEVSFSSLLEKTYITKIEKYTDEKVVFSNEKPKGEGYYSVHTEILSKGRSIPVDYSLQQQDGRWVVYDVNVEGVSLVTNYRSQFRETIHKEGFQGLMQKLEEKIKGLGEA